MRKKCLLLQARKILVCIGHQLSMDHIKRSGNTFIIRYFAIPINRFIGNDSLLRVDRREEERLGIKIIRKDLKVVDIFICLSDLLKRLTPKEEGQVNLIERDRKEYSQ